MFLYRTRHYVDCIMPCDMTCSGKKIPNLPAVSNLIQNINCNINYLVNMPSLNTDNAYLKTFSTTNYAPLYSSQKLIHVSNIIQTVLYMDSVYRLCPCVSHDQTWSQTATLTLQRAPLRPSLSLFRPPPVSSPRSLPPRCSEVIAPAEPQAVVASRRLPFLLIRPGSSFQHDSRSRSRIGQEREATPSNQPSPGAPPSPSSLFADASNVTFSFLPFFFCLSNVEI